MVRLICDGLSTVGPSITDGLAVGNLRIQEPSQLAICTWGLYSSGASLQIVSAASSALRLTPHLCAHREAVVGRLCKPPSPSCWYESIFKESEKTSHLKQLQVALDAAEIGKQGAKSKATLAKEKVEALKSEIKQIELK
ncbi:hypothetical protein PIB30_078270, partial [Stylosanthes scabra]|nr:hypothetical protein [Stylosanthes scabra]